MSDNDTDTTEDEPMRAFTRALFAPDEPDETAEPDEQQKPPGYVAREGNIPQPPHDDGMRAFTKALFGHDPNS